MNKGLYKKILIVLLIGFLFRLSIIFFMPVRKFDESIKRYHYAAVNMLEGRGYSHFDNPPYQPSFYKPPVYSIFLAIIYKIFGINVNAVKIVQALIDTLGCLLLFLLLHQHFNQRLAFWGLWLAILCPITAVYTNLLNPEIMATFFMILSLWLISKSISTGKLLFFFAAGLSTILMGYCRLELFGFVLIFGIYLFVTQIKKCLKKALLYALGILIIMTPWVVRNYYLTGKFIPLSAGSGLGFSIFYGTFEEESKDVVSLEKFYRKNPEIESKINEWYKVNLYARSSINEKINVDRALMEAALEIIKKNPWRYIVTRVKTMPRVWISLHADEFTFLNTQNLRLLHPDLIKIVQYIKYDPKQLLVLGAKYLLFIINIFYLLMALRGLWAVRSKLSIFSFIILPLLYAQSILFFIQLSANFTVPYWPCIIFFSAIGFYCIFFERKYRTQI